MNRNMKLSLVDASESSNLALVNKALWFAERNNSLVSFFDTHMVTPFMLPSIARVIISKNHDRFFTASAFIGNVLASVVRDPYFQERAAELFVVSNLYSSDDVYPLEADDVKLSFIAMPRSEAVEWFKGEYRWAKVYSWQQAEDYFS
jgi:hypothetical protein